jgi:hypothetical protein
MDYLTAPPAVTTGVAPKRYSPFEYGMLWHNTDYGEVCHGPQWFVDAVKAGRLKLSQAPGGRDWTLLTVVRPDAQIECWPGDWLFIDTEGGLHVMSRMALAGTEGPRARFASAERESDRAERLGVGLFGKFS